MADDAATDTAVDEAPEVATDEEREALLSVFSAELGEAVVAHEIKPGLGLWIRVATEAWPAAAEVAAKAADCGWFDFLSAIDWLPSPYGRYEDSSLDVPFPPPMPDRSAAVPGYTGGDTRLQVLASAARMGTSLRVLLKADVPDDDPVVGTWIRTFAGAAWHERETAEMFGIRFGGNADLRNMYLPTEFEGHPLRKEFPLLARVVKPWPGIVDVEPMPGGGDDEDEATEGGEES
ncbi:MAG: NADH-quinone oxidoreductase subunit C [Acidimicrobiales bacterium]|nr:NADH-quinone oxidoreductase subunit C [Acidimicrobiales bacterium]